MSDQILMELVGDRVRIQLMPEVEAWTKARNITLPSALAIAALMMRSGALHDTLTVEGDPEMVVQVMGGSDRCAWLGISAWGYKGDPDIIGCIEGDAVIEIGRCIHDLCLWAAKPDQMPEDRSIFVRDITTFHLRSESGNHGLDEMKPMHG